VIASDLLGWTATVVGALLFTPQLVRLVRTRNVDGLSLIGWQIALLLNIAWAVHGALIRQLPQTLSNALGLLTTVPILVMVSRTLKRRLFRTLWPSLLLALVMIGVDGSLGSAVFGVIAIFPGIAIVAAQSVELVRSRDVLGVSPLSTVLGLLNLSLWVIWAVLVSDSGTLISLGASWFVALFNVVWYVLRRSGLRPLFTLLPADHPVAAGNLDVDGRSES
jgi:uncharacterized protein with PQ loop repeat